MSLTIDCGEGRHSVCRGAGTEHYLIPQHDDGTEFVCACRCHIVDPDPEVREALKEIVEEDDHQREVQEGYGDHPRMRVRTAAGNLYELVAEGNQLVWRPV